MLHQTSIRLSVFVVVLVATALWEIAAPCRDRSLKRTQRWPANLAMVALGAIAIRLLLPVSAIAMALLAASHHWGLFNYLALPLAVTLAASVVLLDFAIYLQHVMLHAIPLLWRFHRMHHADLDFDVTTGPRFHPVEYLLSMGIKIGVVAALGPPALAVLIFEVLLNATSMFNHANLRLPAKIDRVLRWLLVTPDMHRVHHSILRRETNSNFGFNLPWWDRLLGTYIAQPAAGHEAMTIGIEQFREARELGLSRMLWQPLRGGVGPYPIGAAASRDRNRR